MSNQVQVYPPLPAFIQALPPATRGALLAILLLAVFFHLRFNRRATSLGPRLLTTVGLFATFLCVALDLADLDPKDIQAGIPALLVGLRSAVWVAVFGIGAALTLRLREYAFGISATTGGQAEPDDLTAADLSRHLGTIQKALSGSDPGALVSQVKVARHDGSGRLARGVVIRVPHQNS